MNVRDQYNGAEETSPRFETARFSSATGDHERPLPGFIGLCASSGFLPIAPTRSTSIMLLQRGLHAGHAQLGTLTLAEGASLLLSA